MADGPTAVYWDSDVIISRIQRTPDRIAVLEYLTTEAENDRLLIVVSTFTIAEVIKISDLPALTDEGSSTVNRG